jgi:hypothetical protein
MFSKANAPPDAVPRIAWLSSTNQAARALLVGAVPSVAVGRQRQLNFRNIWAYSSKPTLRVIGARASLWRRPTTQPGEGDSTGPSETKPGHDHPAQMKRAAAPVTQPEEYDTSTTGPPPHNTSLGRQAVTAVGKDASFAFS